MTSYRESTLWKQYQSFFPEALRCTPESTPREQWWRWRGIDVHLDRMPAPEAAFKIIVLHGVGAYGRVMAPAAVLARRYGYETVAPDLPGYGLTQVPRRRMEYRLWIDCVCDLIEAEQARDDRPIVLFGVSLGGLLAYQVAARSRRVAGLIATTLADLRDREVRRGLARTPLFGGAGLWLLDKLSFVADRLPLPVKLVSKMHHISNRPALSALCMADPRGGGNWVPARFFRTMMNEVPAIEPEQFDVCPVLLAHPGRDRMTDIAFSRRFFERLPGDKRLVVLDNASHMPTEHPGIDQLEASVMEFLAALERRQRTGRGAPGRAHASPAAD